MCIGSHEYANEADNDVPKPAQSLGTPVPRQKLTFSSLLIMLTLFHACTEGCRQGQLALHTPL